MKPSPQSEITWSDCPDQKEPDWRVYDALELADCLQGDGYVERVEADTTPTFYTRYGHLTGGGCEALHDWPDGYHDLEAIRAQCTALGQRLGFEVWDMAA